jgi:GT2 family glycosyltransferase
MTSPRVSVVIDTFNHAAFIEQAIESALAQDFPAEQMEVLVVDDGSTDDTPARAQKFGDRVRYLRKENGGQASAFNFAIPQTRGEIISFLDGDDWWAPGKLSAVVNALDRYPEVGAVGHGFWQVNELRDTTEAILPPETRILRLASREQARWFSWHRAFLGTSRFTARRGVLNQIVPVPEALIVEADEYLFTLAVALSGALVLNQPLFYYRLHGENLYQFQRVEESHLRRKLAVTNSLMDFLPAALRRAGIPEEAIAAVIEPLWADREVFRLSLDGGWPWETFRAERALAQLHFPGSANGSPLLKPAALLLALLLPARTFYRLKRWYARSRQSAAAGGMKSA